MNELLDEMELALSDLLQAGLASAGPEAAGRLRTLARQGEQAGLHTGAQLLEEVAADLEARTHRMQKDDQTLTDRICRAGRYLALSVLDGIWDSCRTLLEKYHRENPLHAGMKVAELRQKLLKTADQPVADAILAELVREGKLKQVSDRYALSEFSVHLTKRQNAIRERLLKEYSQAGLETPGLDEVYGNFAANEQTDCRQVVESLVTSGELVMLTPQICIHPTVYQEVCRKTRDYLAAHETLALADFRDMLGTSRKYALAVLEYYDKNKILKKDGDLRRMGLGFQGILPEES